MAAKAVLLDTNAVIRIQLDMRIHAGTTALVDAAAKADVLWVSVVTAWELAMLARNDRSRTGRLFGGDAEAWFERVLETPGVRLAPVSHKVAMAACVLPSFEHRDPADRLLIAQARDMDLILATRDQTILDYAALGHVRAIAC